MKATFRLQLALVTLAAIAAAWFWVLPPLLMPLGYIYPADWTQADLVRHLWRFRLVPPERVSTPPNYMRWAWAETLARLIVVFLAWLTSTTFILRRYLRNHGDSPQHQPLQATAAQSSSK